MATTTTSSELTAAAAAATTSGDQQQPSSEQEYVLAGSKEEEQALGYGSMPDPNNRKRGHKCCGGCCDTRRATMIVNFVNIGLILLAIWSLTAIMAYSNVNNYSSSNNAAADDELEEYVPEANAFGRDYAVIITIMVVRMIMNAIGAYGAYSFNVYMVGFSLAAYLWEAIMAIIGFSLSSLLLAGFFAYPHVFFIREVRAGTMTKENYPNEQQSCCCV